MVIIGVGMLAFLLPTDGIQGLFGGNDNSLGEIGNVEVTGPEFNRRLEIATSQWESQNQSTASAEIRESLREQVWNEIVREEVLVTQFSELGIGVSPEELFDMVQGNNPHPQVQQAFTDPSTGLFNPSQVLQFLKSLETMPAENRNQWLLFVVYAPPKSRSDEWCLRLQSLGRNPQRRHGFCFRDEICPRIRQAGSYEHTPLRPP